MKKIIILGLAFWAALHGLKAQSETQEVSVLPAAAPALRPALITLSEKRAKRLMFLNAYNFDFGATSLSSNYVGNLNLFAPTLEGRWGFNTGIIKINYGQNDTTVQERQVIENILLSPFEQISSGGKYLKQLNSYKTTRRNTVWSFYVQPIYKIGENSDEKRYQNNIYIHGHVELLAAKWTSKTTITNMKQDTAIYTPAPGFVAKSLLSSTSSYSHNALSGYFGAGLTFDLNPWEGGGFFFQPTVGITSNHPQPSSVDINNPVFPTGGKDYKEEKWHSFYLIRAYYNHKLGENSTVVIGVDIRGLFPLYEPLYAAYAGVNISLEKALKVITGED